MISGFRCPKLCFFGPAEASTKAIARGRDAQGFDENKRAAREGGESAGDARKNLEIKSNEVVVAPDSYLEQSEREKRLRLKMDG